MATSELSTADLLTLKIASLSISGSNMSEISRELSISRDQVRRIMGTPEFRAKIKELGDAALSTAKEHLRSEMGKLSKEVLRVITANLEKDNLEAVKVALKIMGFDQAEQQVGDTNIQVVLPGVQAPTIPTTSHPVEDSHE